jgi:heme a synthase
MQPPGTVVNQTRFARLALIVLFYAVAVIVWGAVVRATGSGAGCGNHWPLCNGEVVPLGARTATLIEYTHRAMSGLILILAAGLVVGAFRFFPRGHRVRRAAVWSLVFVLIEAAIGAGIVLLQLVEENASALRAGYIAVHLVNTMLLTAAMTATAWWAWPRPAEAPPAAGRSRALLLIGLGAMLLVSASGAVVALGDTLFPSASLAAGLAADLNPTSSFLIRLRVWHPLLAAAVALYLPLVAIRGEAFEAAALRWPRRLVIGLVLAQIALGVVNLVMLAPLVLQMAHLLVANLLWITLVWAWLEVSPRGRAATAALAA